jgi:tetratricopeptide (TPR) repeat protein
MHGRVDMTEEAVFAAALEITTVAERQAFLDETCSADVGLRRRVEELLAGYGKTGGILERDSPASVFPAVHLEPPLAPNRLFAGRFRLRQKLGEGGMGEVWAADQTAPLQRRVALKVLRAGFDSARLLARFEQERQALVLMDHPNIATVFDAGIAQGRPYFVMELIQGEPITQHCDNRNLNLRERIALFISVCQAVQHAHQKGIIHRDLKPPNILVESHDGKSAPKVIDFGIAKATGARLTEASIHTEVGWLIGTLEYMSPEQAKLNNPDIDTKCDIYTLGAVLYELLSGSVPFSRHEPAPVEFAEMLRLIQDVDPPQPSSKLAATDKLSSIAAARLTEPAKLIAQVRGELDWIVMKCLEKDRAQRYATANELAFDLQRYLADEPVVAGPPSAGYRLRKFVRRHRHALTTALAFVFLLVAAVVMLTVALVAVNRERQEKVAALEAEGRRRKQARAALDAMSSELVGDMMAKKAALLPRDKQFLELALRSYEEYAADTGQEEESRAGVAHAYGRVGCIRGRLGQRKEAEAAWVRSRELYARLVADFPFIPAYRQGLADNDMFLGVLYDETGRGPEAEAAFGESLNGYRKLADDFPNVPEYRKASGTTLNNLGLLLKNLGRPREAEQAYGQAVTILKKLADDFPRDSACHADLAFTYINLGVLLDEAPGRSIELAADRPNRLREAATAYEKAVSIFEQLVAADPTDQWHRDGLARSRSNLGNVLRDSGRHSEAEESFRKALTIRNQLVADFPAIPSYRQGLAIALNNLGILLKNTGRAQEAEELYGQAVTVHRQLAATFPAVPDHQNEAAGAMVNLARVLLARKELNGARRLLEEALPYHRAALNAAPNNPAYRRFYRLNRWRMAETLLELKDHAGAAETAQQFLKAATEPPRDAYTAAGLLAGCVKLAAQDEQLPANKRQESAANYGDSAVAALRLAIEKRAMEVAKIKTDPSLDPLRHREDFQKLLAEWEAANRN